MKKKLLLILVSFNLHAFAQNFHCGDLLTDQRDGQQYRTVLIGGQCWMQDNLNFGSTVLSSVGQIDSLVVEKYCYDNDPANCILYGGLYTWNESVRDLIQPGPPDICPAGWFLPTDQDWKILEMYLGLTQTETDTTGMRGTTQRAQLEVGGSSGFEAKFSGFYNRNTQAFEHIGDGAFFWTKSFDPSPINPIRRGIYSYFDGIYRGPGTIAGNSDYGYCVRCLADNITLIKDQLKNNETSVFPIPTCDHLFVELPNSTESSIQISDLMGRVMIQLIVSSKSNVIDVSALSKGVYMIRINALKDEIAEIKKIIIE